MGLRVLLGIVNDEHVSCLHIIEDMCILKVPFFFLSCIFLHGTQCGILYGKKNITLTLWEPPVQTELSSLYALRVLMSDGKARKNTNTSRQYLLVLESMKSSKILKCNYAT